MSATADVLAGMAGMLVTAGIGVERTGTDVYQPGDTGIGYKDLPADPDRFITLSTYGPSGEHPTIPMGKLRVQAMLRGTTDPGDVDDLAEEIFNLWHGATDLTFGTVHVVQILRISSLPLGMDSQSRRWMRSDNYQLDLDYPATANRT